MAQKKFQRIVRPATAEERQRHAEIRRKVQQEFPPAPDAHQQEAPPGISAQIRRARKRKASRGTPSPNSPASRTRTPYAISNMAVMPSCPMYNLWPKCWGYAWSWCKRQSENVSVEAGVSTRRPWLYLHRKHMHVPALARSTRCIGGMPHDSGLATTPHADVARARPSRG